MSTPLTGRPMTRGQQLAAQAAEAAEVRDALTHPDVVALRVEKARTVVEAFIWTGMILGLLFTMTNVQQFTAHTIGAAPGSLGWWAAWLLDPTVSLVLLGILLAERHTARWQIKHMGEWTRVAKWALLAATYVMNTWQSWADTSPAGIVLHSVPPLVVFMGAEAVTELQDKLTECVHQAHTAATQRADRKAQTHQDKANADRARAERDTPAQHAPPAAHPVVVAPAPIGAPALAPFRAVPTRPNPTPAERPTERPTERPAERSADRSGPWPADRSGPPVRSGPAGRPDPARPVRSEPPVRTGPVRKRTGKPRTDADLSQAVRELAEQTGAPPTQYAIKQALGVGSGRAARLLAELELDVTPAGSPGHNGAATRKDGAR